MPEQRLQLSPRVRLPDPDRRIAAACGDLLPIGREGDRVDQIRASLDPPDLLACGHAPEPNGPVVAPRQDPGSIGRDRHRRDLVGVPLEALELLPRHRAPDAKSPVVARRDHARSVGEKRDSVDDALRMTKPQRSKAQRGACGQRIAIRIGRRCRRRGRRLATRRRRGRRGRRGRSGALVRGHGPPAARRRDHEARSEDLSRCCPHGAVLLRGRRAKSGYPRRKAFHEARERRLGPFDTSHPGVLRRFRRPGPRCWAKLRPIDVEPRSNRPR